MRARSIVILASTLAACDQTYMLRYKIDFAVGDNSVFVDSAGMAQPGPVVMTFTYDSTVSAPARISIGSISRDGLSTPVDVMPGLCPSLLPEAHGDIVEEYQTFGFDTQLSITKLRCVGTESSADTLF